jgi:hypothetical protein
MTPREQEEYRALRATIRERGTARVVVFAGGTVAWAALAFAVAAVGSPPVATLLPLLVLAAVFEAVFALHVGVERVGRYLDVWFGDEWERTAAAFGRPDGAATIDALFAIIFLLAALVNLSPAALAQPTLPEIVFIGGAHALFVIRVAVARRVASAQRAVDLARFKQIKESLPPGTV